MARLAWFLNLVAFVFVTVNAGETTIDFRPERQSDPKIFGVASIARVTSRNGRISTSGGVHFYPGPGPNTAKEFYKLYNPATSLKAINGKYGSSIQIHPGALGVSSALTSSIGPAYWPMDWRQWQWPMQNQYLFEDPWRVKELPEAKMREFVYPSFNPFFNFWR
ncbi:uncharacterized protein LOC125225868 [Leguminivora glycinivorella]|uniref:uncharacterized protein LOC125225868 n=1 Tax=Leguminivora glycinivorella TaxID=1035111 RepID=UPI00201003A2|nr:uncharacterized protein LOC125225868 [Leguminivora glycinivorella]